MSDEIYDQMVYDDESHVCLLQFPSLRDRLILLNGWSKTYAMTGWRLGYAVWPRKTYHYPRQPAGHLYFLGHPPSQIARASALARPPDPSRQIGRGIRQRRQGPGAGVNP